MELTGSILLTLAVAVIVVLFISRPFLQRHPGAAKGFVEEGDEQALAREHERSALMAEHDRVLLALQELDFDHGMGKVPEEDYPYQRAALLQTGADTLRRLDALQAEIGTAAAVPAEVEDRIEAAVAARRADAAKVPAAAAVAAGVSGGNGSAVDDIENLIAARKRERTESVVGFCPRCGKPLQKSDKFCPRCGAAV